MHRLITIRISHYNEKARWALDRFEVPYTEEGYMPLLHMPAVLLATRGRGHADRLSTRLSTPVLITDDGEVVSDSVAILRRVSERHGTAESTLYPNDEAAQLEQELQHRLGPHTRRAAYVYALAAPAYLEGAAHENVSASQARVFKALQRPIVASVRRALGVTPANGARSLEKVRVVFAEIGERLGNRSYLVGDRFTAADLTFAALSAPLLLPSPEEGYGAVLPALDEAPNGWGEIARELRDTAAGAYAMRMFREERGERRIAHTF